MVVTTQNWAVGGLCAKLTVDFSSPLRQLEKLCQLSQNKKWLTLVNEVILDKQLYHSSCKNLQSQILH